MEVLTQMRTSFDKPDHMAALFKKLTCKHKHTHILFTSVGRVHAADRDPLFACSCGQRVEEDDHHWSHLVLPLPGSGSFERRKITQRNYAVVMWCESVCSAFGLVLSGAVVSHSLPGQFSGGF